MLRLNQNFGHLKWPYRKFWFRKATTLLFLLFLVLNYFSIIIMTLRFNLVLEITANTLVPTALKC